MTGRPRMARREQSGQLKQVPEVCHIFCATANPVEVVLAELPQGRAILGVVDGGSPLGVETEDDIANRKTLLRQLGTSSDSRQAAPRSHLNRSGVGSSRADRRVILVFADDRDLIGPAYDLVCRDVAARATRLASDRCGCTPEQQNNRCQAGRALPAAGERKRRRRARRLAGARKKRSSRSGLLAKRASRQLGQRGLLEQAESEIGTCHAGIWQ